RLHVAGEEDLAFDRLTGYLVGLAEPVVGDGMLHCYEELQPLDLERANLAAATEWATRRDDPRHVHLATALGRCWRHHGYISDGRTLLRTALDGAPADHPGRSAALVQAAWLATTGGDHAEARRLAGEAVRLDERSGGTARLARALDMLTWVQLCAGQDADADRTSQRALRLVPELERPLDAAVCLHNHAYY